MLEQWLYHSRLGRVLSAAALAGTLAFSAPAHADVTPARASCERTIPGAVEIGYTGYCTDRFGVIYDTNGEVVREAGELRGIERLEAYSEAKEAAEALHRQREAERARGAAQPSPLEERVGETAAPARGPPPPYLRLPVGEGEERGSPSPLRPSVAYSSESPQPSSGQASYTNVDPDKKEKETSDYTLGTLSLLLGVGGIVAGAYNIEAEICQSGPGMSGGCSKTLDPLSLAILISGVSLSGLGLYLLSR